MGELHLTPEQFANYTVKEIDALFEGYLRRYERLEDLFIIDCALPAYRAAYGKKAPSYKKLTSHRKKRQGPVEKIDDETETYWKKVLGGLHGKADKSGKADKQSDTVAPEHTGCGRTGRSAKRKLHTGKDAVRKV